MIPYEERPDEVRDQEAINQSLFSDNYETLKAAKDAIERKQREKQDARFTAPIVCMCGSTRFKQSWIAENARLTGEGNIVLAVGLWGHHERKYPDAETKLKLDDLHKRKIDLCDWVWVLDVDGYIGDSTRSEIEYAQRLGRPIRYLSREFPDYTEPVDPLERANAELQDKANCFDAICQRFEKEGITYWDECPSEMVATLNNKHEDANAKLRAECDRMREAIARADALPSMEHLEGESPEGDGFVQGYNTACADYRQALALDARKEEA